jgi:APA family basic amino acid/polyamine antiporter
VHPRFETPAFAIVALAVWSALLAASGTFEQLLTYVVFTGWAFYALGALSIFAYRRRDPTANRPFSVPGYPLTPLLFVLSAGLLVANTVVTQPARASVGVVVVLLGTPAFYAWRARLRSSAANLSSVPVVVPDVPSPIVAHRPPSSATDRSYE